MIGKKEDTMGRTTIISIVNTNVVVLCCVNIYHKNFLVGVKGCVVLCCTALHCTALHCTALHCNMTL